MTSVKWNGREVQNPIMRMAVAACAVIGCAVMLPIAMAAMVCGLVVALPFHPLFRLFGRKGIAQGGGNFVFDKTSFERR